MHVEALAGKQKTILDAAWAAFSVYGFRKTSMDDIARAAGMSRPALYLHYKNKDDIFRSLVEVYFDTAAEDVAAALVASNDTAHAIRTAFLAQGGAIMETMLTSPHGLELLDSSHRTAADVAQRGEARLQQIYTDWLARSAEAGRVRLPDDPESVAETITSALHGFKTAGLDPKAYRRRVEALAHLVAAALVVD